MMVELYQGLKPHLVDVLALSKDAIHIHVGFLSYLVGLFFLQHKQRALIVPLLLSIVMEVLDAVADIRRTDSFFWSAYAHDLLNTNLIPGLFHAFLMRTEKKKQDNMAP